MVLLLGFYLVLRDGAGEAVKKRPYLPHNGRILSTVEPFREPIRWISCRTQLCSAGDSHVRV